MKIPKETVKETLDRVNIVELISEYVAIPKNGRNYIGLCPFHNEKKPSFTVFAESGRFQCFGCGEKGDAITFLMKKENLSYGCDEENEIDLYDCQNIIKPYLDIQSKEEESR